MTKLTTWLWVTSAEDQKQAEHQNPQTSIIVRDVLPLRVAATPIRLDVRWWRSTNAVWQPPSFFSSCLEPTLRGNEKKAAEQKKVVSNVLHGPEEQRWSRSGWGPLCFFWHGADGIARPVPGKCCRTAPSVHSTDRCSQNPETSSTRVWITPLKDEIPSDPSDHTHISVICVEDLPTVSPGRCADVHAPRASFRVVFNCLHSAAQWSSHVSKTERYWDRMSASVLLNKVNVSILPVGSFGSGRGFITGPYISPWVPLAPNAWAGCSLTRNKTDVHLQTGVCTQASTLRIT